MCLWLQPGRARPSAPPPPTASIRRRANVVATHITRTCGDDGGADLSEVGTVLSIADGIARVHGLENCMSLEMLELPHDVVGLALNLEEDNVGSVLFGDWDKVSEGDTVKRTGRLLEIPVGEQLLGRRVTFQACLQQVVGEGEHAATRVMNKDDLVGVQQVVRDDETPDHIVGHDAPRVAQDVRVALLEPERGEHVETGVHARDDRQPAPGAHVQVQLRQRRREPPVVLHELVYHVHA